MRVGSTPPAPSVKPPFHSLAIVGKFGWLGRCLAILPFFSTATVI